MFHPKRMYFEKAALAYPTGERAYKWAKDNDVPIEMFPNTVRYKGNDNLSILEQFGEAKGTLAVTVKRSLKFQTCKPSAHYQLPLVTGCPGFCQYCYLFTNLGTKPYLRIYANVEEILQQADSYMEKQDEITVFEGAATSDPIPVEHICGSLGKAISFFGESQNGRFRFVSKFTDVDSLLSLEHNGHTTIRFSLNADSVITEYEKGAPRLNMRIEAAAKVAKAGYPTGFIIAPIIHFKGWQQAYSEMFEKLQASLPDIKDIPFELITHRYSSRAKENIHQLFPNTTLPMDEAERRFKFGQFGYGKYLYKKETFDDLKLNITSMIKNYFPTAKINYFV